MDVKTERRIAKSIEDAEKRTMVALDERLIEVQAQLDDVKQRLGELREHDDKIAQDIHASFMAMAQASHDAMKRELHAHIAQVIRDLTPVVQASAPPTDLMDQ